MNGQHFEDLSSYLEKILHSVSDYLELKKMVLGSKGNQHKGFAWTDELKHCSCKTNILYPQLSKQSGWSGFGLTTFC